MYRVVEITGFVLSVVLIILMFTVFANTRDFIFDKLKFYYIIPPAFLFALFVHPNHSGSFFIDVNLKFLNNLYFFCLVCLDFLYLFGNAVNAPSTLFIYVQSNLESDFVFSFYEGGTIEDFTGHFVAAQGLSKLCYLAFWWYSFPELNKPATSSWVFVIKKSFLSF